MLDGSVVRNRRDNNEKLPRKGNPTHPPYTEKILVDFTPSISWLFLNDVPCETIAAYLNLKRRMVPT